MTHIFISYKREEVSIAQKVRLALRAEGFDVWWDDNLQGGQQWAETIDNKLLSAGAVVVLWSAASAQSDWVKHEASIAKSRNVLIPAKISTCSLPDAFASIQTVNLIGWNDSELAPGFQELSDVITNTINRRRRKRVLRIATTVMCVVAAFAIGIVLDQYYFFRKYSFLGPIRVALKTYHQRYVSAEDGGQNWALQGRRLLSEGIAQYETFELIPLGGNQIALKTYHQRYVSAEDGGQNWALRGRRLLSEGIAQYETFELKSIPVTMR